VLPGVLEGGVVVVVGRLIGPRTVGGGFTFLDRSTIVWVFCMACVCLCDSYGSSEVSLVLCTLVNTRALSCCRVCSRRGIARACFLVSAAGLVVLLQCGMVLRWDFE